MASFIGNRRKFLTKPQQIFVKSKYFQNGLGNTNTPRGHSSPDTPSLGSNISGSLFKILFFKIKIFS